MGRRGGKWRDRVEGGGGGGGGGGGLGGGRDGGDRSVYICYRLLWLLRKMGQGGVLMRVA